jgi:hypothetical protein
MRQFTGRWLELCRMKTRSWLRLSVVVVAVLAAPPSAVADSPYWEFLFQDKLRDSHILDEERFPEPVGKPEEVEQLVRRHARERYQRVNELLQRYGLKIEDVDKHLETLKKNPGLLQSLGSLTPDSPLLPPQVRKAIRESKLTPDKVEEYQKFLSRAQEELKLVPATAKAAEKPPSDAPQASDASSKEADQTQSSSSAGPQTSGTIQGQQASVPLADRLMQWLGPSLRNSPAVRRALSDLGRHAGTVDPRWDKLTQGAKTLQKNWQGWDGSQLGRLLPERAASILREFGVSLPGFQLPESLPGSRSARGGASADGSGNFTGWHALAILGGFALVALLVRAVLARSSAALGAADGEGRTLGPWPVDPAAVGTREELVRAFEYLSLLSLGIAARTWNHRTIAKHLSWEVRKRNNSESPASLPSRGHTSVLPSNLPDERRRAAFELAGLYEKARYAPPSDSLPDTALAAARRDLCFLAGVSAA